VSGFSPDWLRLREPADHRARDRRLVGQLAGWLGGRETISVVDLGCGTGSNLRALSPALPAPQTWRLVDYDPLLLSAARQEIAAWAGAASPEVSFEAADLARDLEQVLARDCDLVTASALFDLVSAEWLVRFAAALAERRRAFYTVLIYDGILEWEPVHPLDAAIRAAFNAHQRSDKGFGPAAGPDAAGILTGALERAGFNVHSAPSPWVLERQRDLPLMLETAAGIADAARQTGLVPAADVEAWTASRAQLTRGIIGHVDILALP
jgi:SAM-dependent methyltransferase